MKDNKKETDFKANFFFANEEIVALYEEKDLAEVAWLFWNDIKCSVDDVLLLLARLACCDEISDEELDCLV